MVLDGFEMSRRRSSSTMHTSQSSPNCLCDDAYSDQENPFFQHQENAVYQNQTNPTFGHQFIFPSIDVDSRTTSKSSINQFRPHTDIRENLPPHGPGENGAKKLPGILKSSNPQKGAMTPGRKCPYGHVLGNTRYVHGIHMIPRIRALEGE